MSEAKPEKLYKTGEVLRETGLSREAFYRYITAGLIRPATLSPGGQNLFDESVFTHIRIIRNLLATGFSLRDVKDIYFKDERLDDARRRRRRS